jgi:uncharacterized membrane protein YqjE
MRLLASIERLGAMLSDLVESRWRVAATAVRMEVRRAVAAVVWGIVAAVAAIFALEFAAAAILIAAWDTHPVVAAVSIAAGFLLLALTAAWAVRRCTR